MKRLPYLIRYETVDGNWHDHPVSVRLFRAMKSFRQSRLSHHRKLVRQVQKGDQLIEIEVTRVG